MDHEGTREQLELAAAEPGGLDRLMAGDTAAAQAVAAHLAGCPACSDELVRLGRASTLIRQAIREEPPADLRARTLAAIRAEGVPRPLVAVPAAAMAAESRRPRRAWRARATAPTAIRARDRGAASRQWLGWAATIAAAVVLSVVTTSFVVNSRVDEQLAAQDKTIAQLEKVTTSTLAVTNEPDAEHVALRGVTDPALDGSLVFSPSTADLVVVATGLVAPPAGQEYRCWVEIDGQRQRVGRMFFSDELAYWTGGVPALSGMTGAATFGVSLVDASTNSVATDPVLLGEL